MRLFLIASLFLLSLSAFSATTIKVEKNGPVPSVKQAILLASDGDTILVSEGTYKEGAIVINKSIVLKGVNYPVLDGESKYEIISILASDVTVDGFKIINSGTSGTEDFAAVKFSQVRNIVIRNNILDNNFFGIYAEASTNSRIEKNIITSDAESESNSGNGIHCWKSDSLLILDNTIKKHRDGIYFEFVSNSVIVRNISIGNIRYGLHFMFSNDDVYIQNYFKENGSGVAVMYSKRVNMIYNFFTQNWGDAAYGLLLKEISDSNIQSNYFYTNTTAVVLEGSSRIYFSHNDFSDNGWGLRIQASCMDVEVIKNNFIANTFDVATNGSLVLNKFSQNYWDKYEGYDLNKDSYGDVPFRPLSLFSVIVENNPTATILYRSFIVSLLEKSEKIIPTLTPEAFIDDQPVLKPYKI